MVEQRRMHVIYHAFYKVVPAKFSRGYWVAICRLCPGDPDVAKPYQSAKSTPAVAEQAVKDHLKDKHDIELTEEVT